MARDDGGENYGQPLKFDPDFKGPLSKRSCTDIPCLFLFVVFLAGWGAVAYYALHRGDLERLLVPTDSNGLKCGVDSEVQKEPYLVFFDISECAKYDVPLYGCKTPQVCVQKCPEEAFRFDKSKCTDAILDTIRSKLICEHKVRDSDLASCNQIQELIDRGRCAAYYLPSVPFSKRCLPDLKSINADNQEQLQSIINAVTNIKLLAGTGQMVVEDILQSWRLVIIFLVLSLVVSLIFITMLRWIAKPMVWISILGVVAALCYGVYYSFTQYSYISQHPVESHVNVSPNLSSLVGSWFKSDRTWLWILIILSILLVVLLLVVLVLRKRIVIAIALVKEGSKAVSAIFSTVFFPIIPWGLHIVVIIFSVVVGLHLASIGEPIYKVYGLNTSSTCVCSNGYRDGDICDPIVFNENCHNKLRSSDSRCLDAACHFQDINSPKEVGYFHAVNVLGFFWGICFVSAFGDMVLAFTFATWYWTFRKKDLRFFVLTTGFMRTVRYHLGTIAFGSLIIAICKIIRAALEYLDHKLRKYDNGVVKAILCCCRCCFWCLESFLKFLNTNAYIMCAIHGKNFCSSAKDAFSLLARNILRVIALDKVTGFLFFLSKLLLACGMAAVTYTFFDSGVTKALHYPFVPAILVFVGTYVIAAVFFSVYSVAVDTLFLCFLEDCERNDGTPEKPFFMSKSLMKILGKKQKFAAR